MNKEKTGYKADFLLSKSNFWVGLGSVLTIAGNYFDYSYSKSEKQADSSSIHSDWKSIGGDSQVSMKG